MRRMLRSMCSCVRSRGARSLLGAGLVAVLMLAWACENDPATPAAGPRGPHRIVSLSPALTQMVIDLGAADKLVPMAAPIAYRDALRDQGVDFELVARGDHEMSDPAARTACVERIAGFFRPQFDKMS